MRNWMRFLAWMLALAAIGVGFALPELAGWDREAERTAGNPPFTVVLDAGHGGEDGGAVSAAGLHEKEVNLAVTLLVRDFLQSRGVRVVLTRETDTMLYDRNTDYKGRKKRLDLQERQKIAEGTPDAVFVSIHMNSFPQSRYHGLQVWYSPNDVRSAALAEGIQTSARELLQPENTRQTKQAGSAIYLLYHLQIPAVLVECGFLSNPEEAALLGTDGYRQQLAQTVALGILSGLDKISGENPTIP